ncbi:hypothetical protein SAMN05216419_101943 [Nitrosomonas cryotolerans]|uniref:Uncharacterized protein n=1 Tax=Nitrosomonas cryotolerans ATCC 49181 TaxID=1131553 RepID=A0A1N6FPU1_9PROT|nr:hypothetical protein [Nitrosomonas cryotolerans]SFP78816.1 hypothetical protein SAMN05216419_101943 [Nitrosomonas cryotolerans]SIN97232.1 hypothetical protein SAMN02743940_0345 [Nitrosomonas cryotolerans ATCC 49181]
MKEVSKGGWVAKISGAVLVSLLALPSYAQLMLAHEGHHGGGGCVIDTGDFSVTFSAYEVPEGDIPPMHSYCDHLPGVGKVNLTVELSDYAAREIPLAVRLIKEGHESGNHDDVATSGKGENESEEADHSAHEGVDHDGHAAKEQGIVYMPAEVHRSGIIVVAAELKELGQYAVLLEKKDDAGNVSTAVRIPLHVGGGGHGGHGGGFGMMEIAILLIVTGGAAFYFLRRKNNPE